ncbi:MAG: hypothetical protein WBP22_02640 [Candidatus Saccharimonas sp.]
MSLEKPFDTFRVEKKAGEYKDFGTANSDYPLKGVTYPVDYGDIEGYTGEDGANLDLFVGDGSIDGYFIVYRPELENGEHKFYLNLTEEEEASVLAEFAPVITEQNRFESYADLLSAIEAFKTLAP